MASDRAPDCTTPRAAEIAGILSAAVMASVFSFSDTVLPKVVRMQIDDLFDDVFEGAELEADVADGIRTAHLMIEARARSSIRTPPRAILSAAEVALALAEDFLDADPSSPAEPDDAFAVLATIRDTLRIGLRPTHEAETAAPPAGDPARA